MTQEQSLIWIRRAIFVDKLKGPKLEMFGALNFTFNRRNICLAISATAIKKLFLFSYVEKRLFLIASICTSIGLERIFLIFNFTLFKNGFGSVLKIIFLIAVAYSA
jgi:hypothetical protein